MRALSIRQPYAELILRGIKRIEYRSRPTKIIGERFFIYASKKWAGVDGHALPVVPAQAGTQSERNRSPNGLDSRLPGNDKGLPTGVIVGTAMISHVTNGGIGPSAYEWHLTDVQRIKRQRKPKGQPQPVWFNPFPAARSNKQRKAA